RGQFRLAQKSHVDQSRVSEFVDLIDRCSSSSKEPNRLNLTSARDKVQDPFVVRPTRVEQIWAGLNHLSRSYVISHRCVDELADLFTLSEPSNSGPPCVVNRTEGVAPYHQNQSI